MEGWDGGDGRYRISGLGFVFPFIADSHFSIVSLLRSLSMSVSGSYLAYVLYAGYVGLEVGWAEF